MIHIEIEGNRYPLPDESLANNDELLRTALSPHFPGVADCQFERSEPGIVKVIKQPGRIGAHPLQRLLEAPETIPLALLQAQHLKQMGREGRSRYLQTHQPEIALAIAAGKSALSEYQTVLRRLQQSPGEPSPLASFL